MEKQFVTSTRTVGHVLERDLRFALGVFVRLLAVGVDGVDKGVFDGFSGAPPCSSHEEL